jgi:alpha-beta hydrolase superfamily lysophospholipase
VSPTLAARAAAKAFFTTMRSPVRPEEEVALGWADRFTIPFGRQRLPAWSFGEGPTVLLSHGWNGRASQLAPLGAALATAGFRAVTFDHPGHGEALGDSTNVPEMAHALSQVDAWLGGAHAVVAHSIGTVATTLAVDRTIAPKRLVYLAPPLDPRRWVTTFARSLGLGPSIDAPLERAVERRVGVSLEAIDPRPIAATRDTPLLIVHDRDDREVPFASGEALSRLWIGSQLVATQGLGHNRVLRSPEIGERILGFLAPLVRR